MTKILIEYPGELKCKATHQPSGSFIFTDAPAEVGGEGKFFSPSDLLACSLATCIATTMGAFAKRKGMDLNGMKLEVEKKMEDQPNRRVNSLLVSIWMPHAFSPEQRTALAHVAHTCPVHKSLHPDVHVSLVFYWKD